MYFVHSWYVCKQTHLCIFLFYISTLLAFVKTALSGRGSGRALRRRPRCPSGSDTGLSGFARGRVCIAVLLRTPRGSEYHTIRKVGLKVRLKIIDSCGIWDRIPVEGVREEYPHSAGLYHLQHRSHWPTRDRCPIKGLYLSVFLWALVMGPFDSGEVCSMGSYIGLCYIHWVCIGMWIGDPC